MTRFGIIGTGRISDWVIKDALEDGRFSVSAVCSRDINKAQDFIERHSLVGAKAYSSVAEMASDPSVEAVYIGTPNQTHLEYSKICMEKGKHVLCEKPLAISAEEGEEMVKIARENNVLLMEAMISTLNPNFKAARELIPNCGDIHTCHAVFCQYSTRYEALKEGKIASSFKPGTGGAIRDIGIYTIYPVVALFGLPERVLPSLTFFETDEGPTDIFGDVILKYPSMDAVLSWSKVNDSFLPTEISGEGGTVLLDNLHDAKKAWFMPHAAPTAGRGPGSEKIPVSEGLDHGSYYYEIKEFIDLIEAGAKESKINTLKVSIETLKIIDKCLNSR